MPSDRNISCHQLLVVAVNRVNGGQELGWAPFYARSGARYFLRTQTLHYITWYPATLHHQVRESCQVGKKQLQKQFSNSKGAVHCKFASVSRLYVQYDCFRQRQVRYDKRTLRRVLSEPSHNTTDMPCGDSKSNLPPHRHYLWPSTYG